MKIETSESSPIGINQVIPPARGREGWLAITLAPGKVTQGHSCYWKRDLAADLDRLKELGATTLVPLLEDDELVRLKIPNLVDEARKRGLDVLRFPFHDGGVPRSMKKTYRFVDELRMRVGGKGERIVIHCNGGLGRSGTIAACVRLIMNLDSSPSDAIASIRGIRGKRAIETIAQERFVKRFSKTLEEEQNKYEPIFLLEPRENGVYEPIYIPPILKDGCEYRNNLYKPKRGRALVRLPQDGKVSEMNVLICSYCDDMYITSSDWNEELARRHRESSIHEEFYKDDK